MRSILLIITFYIYVVEIKTAEINGIIKPVSEQVLNIVCSYLSMQVSHEDLIILGLICKSNDAYLRNTTQERKKYLEEYFPYPNDHFRWHQYGSSVYSKKIVSDFLSTKTKKNLILEQLKLLDSGKIHKYSGNWQDFELELPHKPTPFYNEKQLQFIGCGWSHQLTHNTVGYAFNINRYITAVSTLNYSGLSVDTHTSEKRLRCILKYSSDKYTVYYRLISMIHFPYLLEAILHSTKVKKIKEDYSAGDIDEYYQYKLEGVTLPHNYKECVLLHELGSEFDNSFEQLPQDLKKALEKRYEEQQKT